MEIKDQSPLVPTLQINLTGSDLYRRRHSHDKVVDSVLKTSSVRDSNITYYESCNVFDPDRKSKLWE